MNKSRSVSHHGIFFQVHVLNPAHIDTNRLFLFQEWMFSG